MTFANERTETPRQSMFTSHIHNDYELFYFVEGDADYVIGSAVYHMNRRDLLVIKPGDYHYLRLRSSQPYERYIINFDEGDLQLPEGAVQQTGMFHIASDSMIHRFFEDLPKVRAAFSQEEQKAFVRSGITMVLLLLKHHMQQRQVLPEEGNLVLKQILQYIDQHPQEAITAGELASRFYVSTSWIVHIFQRCLGISLMQYVREKRIRYAQALIQQGAAPMEVAVQCQFENYATFYRQYKAVLGCSPKEDKLQDRFTAAQ